MTRATRVLFSFLAALALAVFVPSLAAAQTAVPRGGGGGGGGGTSDGGGGGSAAPASSGGGWSAPAFPVVQTRTPPPSGSSPSGQAVPRSGSSGSSSSGGTAQPAGSGSSGGGGNASGVPPSYGGPGARNRNGHPVVGSATARTTPIVTIPGYAYPYSPYGAYYPYYGGYGSGGLGYIGYNPWLYGTPWVWGMNGLWWYDPWYNPYGYGYGYGGSGASEAPREESADMGAVRLRMSPSNAKVYVDGALEGIVDDFNGLTHHLYLSAGTHHLEIKAPGYQTYSADITVETGRTTTYRASLTKK